MRYSLLLIGFLFTFLVQGKNINPVRSETNSLQSSQKEVLKNSIPDTLQTCMAQAWDVSWNRFYSSKTHLFYDYISSYENGQGLAHLPTADEVSRQYPNPCGYGTGMEDCMILGGTMLSTMVDRYDATKDKNLKEDASKILDGIKSCAKIPGVPGFVARGICVEDGKSFYINSSRDQYTHCVYGLWKYYRSPLCDVAGKKIIRGILTDIAERMSRNVISENHYDFLRADNKECPLGICRMWNVQAHEAARLPMLYAAAWDVTKNKNYYNLYRHYIYDAIAQSEKIGSNYSGYVYLQMQYSFDLLYQLERDNVLKDKLKNLMSRVEQMSLKHAVSCEKELRATNKDSLAMLGSDWRQAKDWKLQNGYTIPQRGDYGKIWNLVRESGENLLVIFMFENPSQTVIKKELLEEIASSMDYQHSSSCGVLFHLAAYWRARNTK